MKTKLFITLLLTFFGFGIYSQTNSPEIQRVQTNYGQNFKLIGESSYDLIDNLFANYPKTNRGKKYVWKFKNINVPGIEEPVTFQVHQGIHGTKIFHENFKCELGCAYFHTFKNSKNKEEMLANLAKNNEQRAVIIYIKKGNKFGEVDKEKAVLPF
jgi:hypothetical protein